MTDDQSTRCQTTTYQPPLAFRLASLPLCFSLGVWKVVARLAAEDESTEEDLEKQDYFLGRVMALAYKLLERGTIAQHAHVQTSKMFATVFRSWQRSGGPFVLPHLNSRYQVPKYFCGRIVSWERITTTIQALLPQRTSQRSSVHHCCPTNPEATTTPGAQSSMAHAAQGPGTAPDKTKRTTRSTTAMGPINM